MGDPNTKLEAKADAKVDAATEAKADAKPAAPPPAVPTARADNAPLEPVKRTKVWIRNTGLRHVLALHKDEVEGDTRFITVEGRTTMLVLPSVAERLVADHPEQFSIVDDDGAKAYREKLAAEAAAAAARPAVVTED